MYFRKNVGCCAIKDDEPSAFRFLQLVRGLVTFSDLVAQDLLGLNVII